MVGRPLPTDRPSNVPRGRTGRILQKLPDSPVYLVAWDGGQALPEAAFYSGTTEIPEGTRVRVTWEQEQHRWAIDYVPAASAETPLSMTFTKSFQFDANYHRLLEAHPANRSVVFTARNSNLVSVNWETESVVDTYTFGSNVIWISPSPDGSLIAVALFSSPYISIIPVDVDGNFGSPYSDPASLPLAAGNQVQFFELDETLYVAMDCGDVSEPVVVYSVTGGAFDTKFTPSYTDGWGYGPISGYRMPLIVSGAYTQEITLVNSAIGGVAVSPDGSQIVTLLRDAYFYFWRNFQFSSSGFNQATDELTPTEGGPGFDGPSHPRFHHRGHLVGYNNFTDRSVGSSNYASDAYVLPWVGGMSPETPHSSPRPGNLAVSGAAITDNKGFSWRPGVTKDQMVFGVWPNQGLDDDTTLLLCTIEQGTFRSAFEFKPGNANDWDTDTNTYTCWADKNTLIVNPDFLDPGGGVLAVIDVQGE